jgi:phosphoglycolate phosphatase
MTKCVIFDFDGTLVQSNEIKKKTFYEVTKDLPGASKELDKLLSSPNSGDRYSIFRQLVKNLQIVDDNFTIATKFSNSYSEICQHKILNAKEINGASNIIKNLKVLGIKVFISSATPQNPLESIIKAKGWYVLFDGVFGSPLSKNEHIQIIINKYRFPIKDMVYVGDSEVDRIVADINGCKFIGIGENCSRFSIKPFILLDSFKNFIEELRL